MPLTENLASAQIAEMSGKKKLILAAFLFIVCAVFLAWQLMPKPRTFVSPKGYVITFEGYDFSTNKTEYRLPRTLLDHRFLRVFAEPIRKHIPRPNTTRIYTRPTFPGEPILSCAFSFTAPSPEDAWFGRVVVADEFGNEYDPVGQSAASVGDNPTYWATEIPAFPRRGRTLTLKLKRNDEVIGEFNIPNPAAGKYPQWSASAVPVTTNSGDLEVKLVDFATEFPRGYSGENFPATRCAFEFLQHGVASTNWTLLSAEIFDATGNHWYPGWYPQRVQFHGRTLHARFFGALWPGEDAWKLRVGFQQQAGFSDDDLIRFDDLPVPVAAEVIHPKLVHEQPDARLELLGLFGPEVSRQQADGVFRNINPRFGMMTVAFKARLAEYQRSFRFIGLYDENGREIPIFDVTSHALGTREETYVPYVLHVKIPPGVKKLSIVCALPKTRVVEFLAKPTHGK